MTYIGAILGLCIRLWHSPWLWAGALSTRGGCLVTTLNAFTQWKWLISAYADWTSWLTIESTPLSRDCWSLLLFRKFSVGGNIEDINCLRFNCANVFRDGWPESTVNALPHAFSAPKLNKRARIFKVVNLEKTNHAPLLIWHQTFQFIALALFIKLWISWPPAPAILSSPLCSIVSPLVPIVSPFFFLRVWLGH